MNRQQKEAVVDHVGQLFAKSHAAFLINYRGLDVSGLQSLRSSLRQDGGVLKVTKARLMKKAVEGISGIDKFKDEFKDQVGLVFAMGEVPSVAKKLVDFSSKNETVKIVSGFFESQVLTQEEISFIASLPTREVLLGQVVGTIQAPLSTLARVLHLMLTRLVVTLKQIEEKKSSQ
jgi:large subunit ribosomal protein L10